MKQEEHKIKHPKDLTGKCPICKNDLTLKEGGGLCICKFCRIEWTFILK